MRFRSVAVVLGLTAGLGIVAGSYSNAGSAASEAGYAVHEWGTFTTRHGPDGAPLVWNPFTTVTDLPKFVHQTSANAKTNLQGTVRMETPVLYFYASERQSVSVHVGFPGGTITEWFPRARLDSGGVEWPKVTILPGVERRLQRGRTDSHYYAARETDAAIVRVRTRRGAQHEKFLFYRGVGTFDLPLTAWRDGDGVIVDVADAQPVAQVVLFERRGTAVGHTLANVGVEPVSIACPPLVDGVTAFEESLRGILTGAGLYAREAQAMLDTWRATWSEEGLRVFYLVPREVTDAVLPLTIDPPPSEVVRVLVGRAEVLDGAS